VQPISQNFQAALGSGTFAQICQVQIWGRSNPTDPTTFQRLLPPSGTGPDGNPYSIAVLQGSVNLDTTQPIFRTLNMSLIDQWGWLMPESPTSPLSAFGNEAWIYSGIEYSNGVQELIPMGKFSITSVIPTWTGGQTTISVQGSDRGYTVGLQALQNPINFNAGTTVASATQTLIGSIIPNGGQLVISPAAYAATLAATTLNQGDNPFTDAATMAGNSGLLLHFDVFGNCQLGLAPQLSGQNPSFTFNTGQGGVLLSAQRPMSQIGPSGPIANNFLMVYEGTSTTSTTNPPVVGQAQDINPASPTYINGPYGIVTQFVYTSVAQGQQSANQAAQLLLDLSIGEADGLLLTTTPNPALDSYDVLQANIPELYVNGTYFLTAATTPFTLGSSQSLTLSLVPS